MSLEEVEALIQDKKTADFWEETVSEFKTRKPNADYKILYNYFTSDLKGLMKEKGIEIDELKITPEHFSHFGVMIIEGISSSAIAKTLLPKMLETGEDPEVLMQEEKLTLISNEEELKVLAKEIIEKNPKAAEDYKKGKLEAVQFLVGQVMAKTRGQADPEVLRELFKKLLG